MDSEIAWLLGIITGDGHISKYYVVVSDRYYENLLEVKQVIERLGYRAKITRDNSEDRYRLWINSKAFVTYMQSLGLHSSGQLPIYVAERKDAHTIVRSFLKGLYDAEGHVEYWKPRGTIRITLANKSRDLIDFTYNYLKRCGLKPYLRYSARAFRIQLYRKGDVRWFIRNIGFRYPVKLRKINKYIKLIYPNGPPLGAEG